LQDVSTKDHQKNLSRFLQIKALYKLHLSIPTRYLRKQCIPQGIVMLKVLSIGECLGAKDVSKMKNTPQCKPSN